MDSNAYHATALVPKDVESNNIEPSHSFRVIHHESARNHIIPLHVHEQRVVVSRFSQVQLPIRVNKQIPEDRDLTFA